MRKPRIRLFQRIILPFLLITLLGTLITIPYGVSVTNRIHYMAADRQLVTVSAVASQFLHSLMDELLAYIQALSQNPEIRSAITRDDSAGLMRYLLPLKARLKLGFVATYNSRGNLLVGLGPADLLAEIGRGEIIRKALAGINIKSMETAAGRMVLVAAEPNEVAGRGMDGCLVAGYIVDSLLADRLSSLVDHEVALMTPEGRLMVTSDRRVAEGLLVELPAGRPRPSYLDFEAGGQSWRGLLSELHVYGQPQALLAIAAPLGTYHALRLRMAAIMVSTGILGAILVVFLGFSLARSITRPVQRLLDLTAQVGRGNLDVVIDNPGRDELGELARSFNLMVGGLRANLDEINSSRAKIARYAHDLERHSLQLERDKREIEAIITNMRDGLVLTDRQGLVLAINPVARQLLCKGSASCLGMDLKSLLATFLKLVDDPSPLANALDRGGSEAGGDSAFEVTTKADRTVWRIRSFPVFVEGKDLLGRIFLWSNITREKEVEEMKNNFLATVSHELRTPLTSIKGSLSLLADGNLGPVTQDQREFIRIANQNSDRLIALVSNLLDLAKMEAGEFRTRKTDADLLTLAQRSLTDISALARQQGVDLRFETDLSLAPVTADPDRVVQIVTNLLDNAIKFSSPGNVVTVAVSEVTLDGLGPLASRVPPLEPGSYFRVAISDQGPGIPPGQMDRIFDKFHQADMSSTRTTGGTGLGLAIARTIVQEHGGAIWAENIPDGGSVFFFILPCRRTS